MHLLASFIPLKTVFAFDKFMCMQPVSDVGFMAHD